jgi:membrane protein implicated in regulation of membrane protease activity
MSWANFYMFCFLVGLFWSIASLLLGHLHLPFHAHAVHGHHFPHAGGHLDSGHGNWTEAGHADVVHPPRGNSLSPWNCGTLAIFLAWFGGVGFLLTAYSSVWFLWGLGLALLSGMAGASILLWFLTKVLLAHELELNPADYEMVGVLGHVSSPIREGGTGEIIFSRDGARQTCGARSDDEKGILKGTEVVVTRYQKGIAYVSPWDELTQTPSSSCPDPEPETRPSRHEGN